MEDVEAEEPLIGPCHSAKRNGGLSLVNAQFAKITAPAGFLLDEVYKPESDQVMIVKSTTDFLFDSILIKVPELQDLHQ
jgi:hypothetical protein